MLESSPQTLLSLLDLHLTPSGGKVSRDWTEACTSQLCLIIKLEHLIYAGDAREENLGANTWPNLPVEGMESLKSLQSD